MARRLLLIILLLAGCYTTQAQQPQVRNFSRQEYHGSTQNWSIAQAPSNRLFFGNNDGLMVFDGDRWIMRHVSNYTPVRAVFLDPKSNWVYVGASNEFGYFETETKPYKTTYHSLIGLLPQEYRSFGEIWNVFRAGDNLIFQSKTDIFIYDPVKKSVNVCHTGMRYECVALIGSEVVVAGYDGVFALHGTTLHPLPGTDSLRGQIVRAILPNGSQTLFVTSDNGVLAYDGGKTVPLELPVTDYLRENQVFCAAIQGDVLAFGTVRGGAVIYAMKTGHSTYANVETGLRNNTVLSAMFDQDGNLWLGLDNGLGYVQHRSPYANLLGTNSHIGTGYASAVYGRQLYLGTGQGLFAIDFPPANSPIPPMPRLLPSMTGQVWALDNINGTLFCGNDNGAYIIDGMATRRINGVMGTWNFTALPQHPDLVLACDYKGFLMLRRQGGSYEMSHRISGLDIVSGGFFVDDDGSVWISDWQKGIYHVWLNSDLTAVEHREYFHKGNGLIVDEGNLLCRWDGGIMISSVDGLYRYDKSTGRLVYDKQRSMVFDTYGTALRIWQTPDKGLWAYKPGFLAFARCGADGRYAVDRLSYQRAAENLQVAVGNVCTLDSHHALFNGLDGFFVLSSDYRDQSKERPTYIRSITGTNHADTLLYLCLKPTDEKQIRIPKSENSLRIEFIQTEYRNDQAVSYSCLLEGYDKEWSQPQLQTSKEYTKLPKGTYTFRVRAFNRLTGNTTEEAFQIEILPAWYETWWAYLFYIVLILLFVYYAIQLLKRRAERELVRVRAEKERQLKEQEAQFSLEKAAKDNELMRLKAEQLEFQMKDNASKLADSTMNLMRKNDMLQALDTQMHELSESVRREDAKASITKKIKDIRHDIQQNINDDDNWEKFEENFNLVYSDYMKRLVARFPDLKMNDRKLCAYLRMGLSSKEMASLLNTSVRSVETARYRLRKKLGMGQGDNLTEFIQSFGG